MSGQPKYWFTADQHFGHELMAKIRGFSNTDEMDATLINAWNNRVAPGDIVYLLGDFMLPQIEAEAVKLLRILNGTKQLIIGNHDNRQTIRAKGWAWTGHLKHVKVDKELFVMSHYALRTWPGAPNEHADGRKPRYNIHGHSHASLSTWEGQMDVGVDTRTDYGPWHSSEVITLLKGKKRAAS